MLIALTTGYHAYVYPFTTLDDIKKWNYWRGSKKPCVCMVLIIRRQEIRPAFFWCAVMAVKMQKEPYFWLVWHGNVCWKNIPCVKLSNFSLNSLLIARPEVGFFAQSRLFVAKFRPVPQKYPAFKIGVRPNRHLSIFSRGSFFFAAHEWVGFENGRWRRGRWQIVAD